MSTFHSCLVLEGGAMRGVYTSGVQGVLHRAGLSFDGVIGTSAGAMNGANFVSNQPERSYEIDYHYARDPRFMGPLPFLRERQIFSFSYLTGPVNALFPWDEMAFYRSETAFCAVATSLKTGRPVYLEKGVCPSMMTGMIASGSLPGLSRPIQVGSDFCLDGGPSVPVAHRRAIKQGYEKIVLILTRPQGYRKPMFSANAKRFFSLRFHTHPEFLRTLLTSPSRYNRLMDEIDRLEAEGRLFVIRPSEPVTVSRMETDQQKLADLFQLGRRDGLNRLEALRAYLDAPNAPDASDAPDAPTTPPPASP